MKHKQTVRSLQYLRNVLVTTEDFNEQSNQFLNKFFRVHVLVHAAYTVMTHRDVIIIQSLSPLICSKQFHKYIESTDRYLKTQAYLFTYLLTIT